MSYQSFSESFLMRDLPLNLSWDLFQRGEVMQVSRDTEILHEGDPPRHLYVILDGSFEVFLPHSEKRLTRVVLGRIGNGQCVGEYSFIDKHPVSATVKALTAGTVYHVFHDDFQRFIEEHHDAGCVIFRNLMMELVSRLRDQNSYLDLFAYPLTG